MARSLVSRSASPRTVQANFSELSSRITLGPELRTATVGGEDIAPNPNTPTTVNQWVAMTQGDQGLLNAIYDFINTTKEGVSVTPDNVNGRTKKMYFNFYGTMGKSVKPGEIGQFEVNFSYPPQSNTGSGIPNTQ